MQLSQSQPARYHLVIKSYPSESSIGDLAQLLYDAKDPTLVASLSSVPYTVGRSFSPNEVEFFADEMKKLKIGFSFKSESPDLPEIQFDPDAKKTEMKSQNPVAQKPDGISWKPLLFALIGLVVVIAGLSFISTLRTSSKSSESPSADEPSSAFDQNYRARVDSITRTVEYRRDRDLLWNRVEVPLALQDQDALRTFEDSQAVLRYREGSSVIVKANTLLVIGSNQNESDKRIDLEDGSVSARLTASKKPQKLSIHTKLGTLEMTSPEEGKKEARFETTIKGEKLAVAVTAGALKLTPRDASQKTVEIQSHQKIEATAESISAPEAYTPSLSLKSPENNSVLKIDPQGAQPIRFEWEDLGSDTTYEWRLSSDEQMKTILLSQKTSAPFIDVQYVDLGSVYWQVSATQNDVEFVSRAFKLNVQNNHN